MCRGKDYNGSVFATALLGGSIAALAPAYKKLVVFTTMHLDATVMIASSVMCASTLIMGLSSSITLSMGAYVLYTEVAELLISIVYTAAARSFAHSHFSLMFGINLGLALAIQTITQLSVGDTLALSVLDKMFYFAVILAGALVGYAALTAFSWIRSPQIWPKKSQY